MKIADRLNTLINDQKINDNKNDVRWFSGWTHTVHTAQYRFSSKEARSLAKKIESYAPSTQKALLRELASRSGGGVGTISFISSESAKVMNKLAKDLGLDLTFEVTSKKQPAPMG